ncbi:uncharacterized protein L201_002768 [Kwoniella dendrophila CBS 6074]|uniref:Uncharacterized protein n=1 Tax=Kwoniella dendrophila CBS 6074 TaxID=1295534 RepID=A0AAX4JTI5_9TREE
MKSAREFNDIEVWVECDGKRLNEYDRCFHLGNRNHPPTFKAFLEIGNPCCSNYTFHVKNTLAVEWMGDLLSDVEIDGFLLCTEFLSPNGIKEAIHDQVYKPKPKVKKGEQAIVELDNIQAQNVEDEEDVDQIVLLNSPENNLGKIVISIWRGYVQDEASPATIKKYTDRVKDTFNGYRIGSPTDESNPWENFQDDYINPWVRFIYTYGTREALIQNDLVPPEKPINSPVLSPIEKEFEILVPDSAPPSPLISKSLISHNKEEQQANVNIKISEANSTNPVIQHQPNDTHRSPQNPAGLDQKVTGIGSMEKNIQTPTIHRDINHNRNLIPPVNEADHRTKIKLGHMNMPNPVKNCSLSQIGKTASTGDCARQDQAPKNITSAVSVSAINQVALVPKYSDNNQCLNHHNTADSSNLVPLSEKAQLPNPDVLLLLKALEDPIILDTVPMTDDQATRLIDEIHQASNELSRNGNSERQNKSSDKIEEYQSSHGNVNSTMASSKVEKGLKHLPEVIVRDYGDDIYSTRYLYNQGINEDMLRKTFGMSTKRPHVRDQSKKIQAGSSKDPYQFSHASVSDRKGVRRETSERGEAKKEIERLKEIVEEKEQRRRKIRAELDKHRVEAKDKRRRDQERKKWLNIVRDEANTYHEPVTKGHSDMASGSSDTLGKRKLETTTDEDETTRMVERRQRRLREHEERSSNLVSTRLMNRNWKEGNFDRKGRPRFYGRDDDRKGRSKDEAIDLTLLD